jgi:hypothetical protein
VNGDIGQNKGQAIGQLETLLDLLAALHCLAQLLRAGTGDPL